MPQPRQVEDLTAQLLAFYASAWTRIEALEQALVDDWPSLRRATRLARLRELRATVEALMDTADEQALRYVERQIPDAYLLGAAAAGYTLGPWTQVDVDALTLIAQDTYSDLLAATGYMRASTKTLIRRLTREHAGDKVLSGDPAVKAGRDLAGTLADQRIAAVVYRNGAQVTLADYGDMVIRTKTAVAYSTATLNQLDAHGVAWVEVFDGVGCGWTSHDDPDKANGTVRPLTDALEQTLSHPRCRRAFGGRTDVTTAAQAARAQPSVEPERQADQHAAEIARQLGNDRRAAAKAMAIRVDTAAGKILTDPGNRVASPAHARVLARRAVTLQRRGQRTGG